MYVYYTYVRLAYRKYELSSDIIRADDLIYSRRRRSLYILGWASSNNQVVVELPTSPAPDEQTPPSGSPAHRKWSVTMRPTRMSVVDGDDGGDGGGLLLTSRDGVRLCPFKDDPSSSSSSSPSSCRLVLVFDRTLIKSPWHTEPLSNDRLVCCDLIVSHLM